MSISRVRGCRGSTIAREHHPAEIYFFAAAEEPSRTPSWDAFLRMLFGGRPSRFTITFIDFEAAASSINWRSSLKDQREGFRF